MKTASLKQRCDGFIHRGRWAFPVRWEGDQGAAKKFLATRDEDDRVFDQKYQAGGAVVILATLYGNHATRWERLKSVWWNWKNNRPRPGLIRFPIVADDPEEKERLRTRRMVQQKPQSVRLPNRKARRRGK